MLKRSVHLLLFLCLCVWATSSAHAQAVYGSIYGTVTDATGAAVPGAKIVVTDTNKGTSSTITSNESGEYSAKNLIPDVYSVRVEAAGFKAYESRGLQVSADVAAQVNAAMAIGGATEEIVVTGETPVLKTDRADISVVLSSQQTENLPNLGRNLTSFELLIPGSQQMGWSHASDENPQGSQQIIINGQLPFSTDYLLDGAENEDPNLGIIVINPNLDSIQETKITTQNFDAEFGKSIAGVVSVQTKSGSNQIHGSAFEYRHSDAQLARDPFTQYAPDSLTGRYIPPTVYNQFGGTLGGPIRKNKLFFFGDYQGVRQKTGASFYQTVPTALVHTSCTTTAFCDLSQYIQLQSGAPVGQGQIYDPTTSATGNRTPFAGNLIPKARVSPAALNLLALLPLPNVPATGNQIINNNYVASGSGGFNTNSADLRIDGQVSDKFHAFGRYSYFGSTEDGPTALGAAGGNGFGIGGYGGHSLGRNQSAIGGGDYQLTSKLSTDFRLGFFRLRVNTKKYDDTAFATRVGIPGLNVSPTSQGAPAFAVDGLSSFGSGLNVNRCNCDLTQIENQFQIVDNWTKQVGNHSIRFGGDLRYLQQYRIEGAPNQAGELTFAAAATSNPGASAAGGTGIPGGQGLATLLLGESTFFQRFVQLQGNAEDRERQLFFFGQDTWRATDKLTLNYGIRYELYPPEYVNGVGKGSNLDFTTGNLLVAGVAGISKAMNVKTTYGTVAPRFGLVYQAHPNTVVRMGYGRSYDIGTFGSIFGEGPTENLPVVANQQLTSPSNVSYAFNIDAGPTAPAPVVIPASGMIPLPNGVSAHARPTTMTLPTVDAWNAAVQQQFGHATSMEIAYVGNKGSHNLYDGGGAYNPNQPTIQGFTPGSNTNLRRPYFAKYGWTQDITYFKGNNSGTYEALQTKVEHRYSNGFTLLANYTWSKSLVYQSDYFNIDPRVNYGPSSYNRQNTFNMSGVYELPFGHGKMFATHANGLLNGVIGGYTLNGDMTASSGYTFTYSYNECGNDRDTGPCRPDKISSPDLGKRKFDPNDHSVVFFTPVAALKTNGAVSGAFGRPQLAHFGNIGNNTGFGPGELLVDLALNKSFKLYDRLNVQFRAEAYNAFNHPNLGNPNSCVDCDASQRPGKITDINGTMRQLQFSGRFQF